MIKNKEKIGEESRKRDHERVKKRDKKEKREKDNERGGK